MKESKCYAEKRFFKWQEDEIAVSLRAKSGSYGGGSEVLIVTAYGFDERAKWATEEKAQTLSVGGARDGTVW